MLLTKVVFQRSNTTDDKSLDQWLRGKWAKTPETGSSLQKAQAEGSITAPNPTCRFMSEHRVPVDLPDDPTNIMASSFIRGTYYRAPLSITRKMLVRVLSFHQVMHSYFDFVALFGKAVLAQEPRFSKFREQVIRDKSSKLDRLGRSGQQYQLCFNLKAAGHWDDPVHPEMQAWTIRHVAINHQFDFESGNVVWIIMGGDAEIKHRIQEMTGPDGWKRCRSFNTPEHCFVSSLEVHLLLCEWSVETWRWYLRSLEKNFRDRVRKNC